MSNKEILFEDDHIQVIYVKEPSEDIVITFSTLTKFADGSYVFAERPLVNLGYSIIGFVAKKGNWYPNSSVELSFSKIYSIIDNCRTIIGYGGSMGGYAVLKYSKSLKMSKAISFIPQYSINPTIIKDERYNGYYKKDINQGMEITANDISLSCRYQIVFDPYFGLDTQHINMIKPLLKDLIITHLKFSGHGAAYILAGSNLLNSFLSNEFDNLHYNKLVRQHKKENIFYFNYLFEKHYKRHPLLFYKLFNGISNANKSKINPNIHRNLINSLILNGFDIDSISLKHQSRIPKKFIKTHSGSLLSYNLISNKISNYDYKYILTYPNIIKLILFHENYIYTLIGGHKFIIDYKDGREQLINYDDRIDNIEIDILELPNGKLTIRERDNYLTSKPDCTCSFSTKKALRWEMYELTSIYI